MMHSQSPTMHVPDSHEQPAALASSSSPKSLSERSRSISTVSTTVDPEASNTFKDAALSGQRSQSAAWQTADLHPRKSEGYGEYFNASLKFTSVLSVVQISELLGV
jgi:hypothetical protein